MEKEKKQLGVAFIVVLVAIVMVSAIGIIAMSDKPVVLKYGFLENFPVELIPFWSGRDSM